MKQNQLAKAQLKLRHEIKGQKKLLDDNTFTTWKVAMQMSEIPYLRWQE